MSLGPAVHEAHCLSSPGFPGILDDPRMFLQTTCAWSPLSEHPRIPGILKQSQDVPAEITCAETPPVWVSQNSQDTWTIPGCSWDHMCMDPTVWVSQESWGTQTLGVPAQVISGTSFWLSEYPRNPVILWHWAPWTVHAGPTCRSILFFFQVFRE